MGSTSIQWTDHSINPLRASLTRLNSPTEIHDVASGHYCEKISPGCAHCYSSRLQPRFGMPQFQEQRRQNVEHWLDPKKLKQVLRRRNPTKFFWCDMTDMFGEWVPTESIAACFGVMAATPQHTHQVLTKRPKRMREWFEWVYTDRGFDHMQAGKLHVALCDAMQGQGDWDPEDRVCEALLDNANDWPLPNVWLGTSVEDQRRAEERVPDLLAAPAAVHFLSVEPLLGPVNLERYLYEQESETDLDGRTTHRGLPGIDWAIVGGESGAKARPFDVEWGRSILRQCKDAGVACFFKQCGSNAHDSLRSMVCGWAPGDPEPDTRLPLKDSHGGEMLEWPEDLRVREFPGERVERKGEG